MLARQKHVKGTCMPPDIRNAVFIYGPVSRFVRKPACTRCITLFAVQVLGTMVLHKSTETGWTASLHMTPPPCTAGSVQRPWHLPLALALALPPPNLCQRVSGAPALTRLQLLVMNQVLAASSRVAGPMQPQQAQRHVLLQHLTCPASCMMQCPPRRMLFGQRMTCCWRHCLAKACEWFLCQVIC